MPAFNAAVRIENASRLASARRHEKRRSTAWRWISISRGCAFISRIVLSRPPAFTIASLFCECSNDSVNSAHNAHCCSARCSANHSMASRMVATAPASAHTDCIAASPSASAPRHTNAFRSSSAVASSAAIFAGVGSDSSSSSSSALFSASRTSSRGWTTDARSFGFARTAARTSALLATRARTDSARLRTGPVFVSRKASRSARRQSAVSRSARRSVEDRSRRHRSAFARVSGSSSALSNSSVGSRASASVLPFGGCLEKRWSRRHPAKQAPSENTHLMMNTAQPQDSAVFFPMASPLAKR
mmetsp:Transcript_20716/g.70173  ORF Transcript_20716/g.70173 Transcript_20716/m.70173 type:complete len:302 (+) Transcript_20716:173-1078(+)